MKINVVQFNILCNAMTKYNVPSDHLDKSVRYPVLINQIRQFIATRAIICLQEVGISEASFLHPLFAKNGFYAIASHYSPGSKDNFGVMIAFPLELYSITGLGQTRIAELIVKPSVIANESDESAKVLDDLYAEAMKRDNTLLWLKLRIASFEFFVFNYHMPCAFLTPLVMTLHITSLQSEIIRVAGEVPFVFCTDLNTQPTSDDYRLLVDDDKLNDSKKSYAANEFTIYCATNPRGTQTDKEFKGILDYIFHSKHFEVKQIPYKYSNEHQPSAYNGSDHFPLFKELSLIE